METVVRYTYRLRPGAQAEANLCDEWNRCRWLWNRAVEHLQKTGEFMRAGSITIMRAEHEWFRSGSVVCQQQMLREFCRKRAKGKGRRKFKSAKKCLPSLNYTQRGFSLRDGKLKVAGGINLPVVWSRELPSEPTSVRVYRDSLGHWYASFVARREKITLPVTGRSIGIDWGVSTIATTTDEMFDLPCPEFGKKSAARLATAQRLVARRRPKPGQRGSKGYRQAKRWAALVSKKVARQRQDTARKWVTKVVAAHDSIAIEDFKPSFLAKSTMARKAADNSVGTTKATLVEYAERAGRAVVMVPPAYTTMTCSACGTRAKSRLLLSERIFCCESCGLVEGRDRNAARNILAVAGFNHADVEAARHLVLPSGEDWMHAESGIPSL